MQLTKDEAFSVRMFLLRLYTYTQIPSNWFPYACPLSTLYTTTSHNLLQGPVTGAVEIKKARRWISRIQKYPNAIFNIMFVFAVLRYVSPITFFVNLGSQITHGIKAAWTRRLYALYAPFALPKGFTFDANLLAVIDCTHIENKWNDIYHLPAVCNPKKIRAQFLTAVDGLKLRAKAGRESQRRYERQLHLTKYIQTHDELFVSVEDSASVGNCDVGTQQFIKSNLSDILLNNITVHIGKPEERTYTHNDILVNDAGNITDARASLVLAVATGSSISMAARIACEAAAIRAGALKDVDKEAMAC